MIQISVAKESDRPTIESIAQRSWHAGYAGVLATEQIDFMLNKSYSQEGLLAAMQDGQHFFLAFDGQEVIGFIALKKKSATILRIEKLYLVPEVQGKGYGKEFIDFAANFAREMDASTLELNVNRKNKAYHFYLKQGFAVTEEIDIPYYGFILDDYIMQKPLALQ